MSRRTALRILSAAVHVASAALCHAQSVEFRIVERTGQTLITNPPGSSPTTDAVLNYAVQARVVGGTTNQFLANFAFDLVALGESDSYGTLSRLLISNADGTYAANIAQSANNTVGRGGLSAIYSYLAGIGGGTFNGLLNTSSGSFTQDPGSQDIGQVTGSPTGGSLLLLTDVDLDGNPDTYPGFGTYAQVDPTIASGYLGAGGNFVDVYRFKYTVSNASTPRFVTFRFANLFAQIGTELQLANGVWGPVPNNAPATGSGATVQINFPAPGTCAAIGVIGTCLVTRRRRPEVRSMLFGVSR